MAGYQSVSSTVYDMGWNAAKAGQPRKAPTEPLKTYGGVSHPVDPQKWLQGYDEYLKAKKLGIVNGYETDLLKFKADPAKAKLWEEGYKFAKDNPKIQVCPWSQVDPRGEGWNDCRYPSAYRSTNPYKNAIGSEAYKEGKKAGESGLGKSGNRYGFNTEAYYDWMKGWHAGRNSMKAASSYPVKNSDSPHYRQGYSAGRNNRGAGSNPNKPGSKEHGDWSTGYAHGTQDEKYSGKISAAYQNGRSKAESQIHNAWWDSKTLKRLNHGYYYAELREYEDGKKSWVIMRLEQIKEGLPGNTSESQVMAELKKRDEKDGKAYIQKQTEKDPNFGKGSSRGLDSRSGRGTGNGGSGTEWR